jgi:hypothetical protein
MQYKGDTYLIIPIMGGQQSTKSTDKLLPIANARNAYRFINVSNYARRLAKFKRTISIIIFDAGREIYSEESRLLYLEKKGMT